MNECKLSTTQCSKLCYSGVWFLMQIIHRVEIHMNLRRRAIANEHCRGVSKQRTQKVCSSLWMGCSASLLRQTHTRTKFITPEVHFHAESIGASLIVIEHKTAKLFKFFNLQTQRNPTIEQARNSLLSKLPSATTSMSTL